MPIAPHVDVVFPTSYRYRNTRGGAEFSTTVIRTKGGKSYRNIEWAQELQRWELSYFDSIATIEAIRAFHRARRGRAQSFLLKDHDDCTAVGEVIGIGDGSTTTFPLKKTYDNGDSPYPRLITKPAANSINIYFDNIGQTGNWNTNAVINLPPFTPLADGIITFSSAPGNGVEITADFGFYFPVRFEEDYLPKSLETHGANTLDSIGIVEERL